MFTPAEVNDIDLANIRKHKTDVDKFFGTTPVTSPTLAVLKKSIDDFNKLIQDIQNRLAYLKLAHSSIEHIKNIGYVVDKGVLIWIPGATHHIAIDNNFVAGIYRLSWISKEKFNVSGGGGWNIIFTDSHAPAIIGDSSDIYQFTFNASKKNIKDKVKIAWCLEFESHLTREELAPGFD